MKKMAKIMMKNKQYGVGDAPELAVHILSQFTSTPDKFPFVNKELTRFLWNSADFSYGVSINDVTIDEFNQNKNFIYDKKLEMFFFSFSFGTHQLFMAYMGALHKMDFTKPENDYIFDELFDVFDAHSKLSDFYIESGKGILLSSVSKKIHLSPDFKMNNKEKTFFNQFERTYID